MARTDRLAILTAAILILGGCSSAASPPGSATPRVEPSAVASPTPSAPPTAMPVASPSPSADLTALAATYSVIAAGGSAAIDQCNKARLASNGTLAQAQAIAQSCRDSYLKYIAALKAVDWGPVQPLADNLIAAADASDAIVLEMVNATGGGAFLAAYDRLPAATKQLLVRVDALRAALGLPPAK